MSMGTSLRTATQPLGESPIEKLTETMLAGFAEFDNDLRAEKCIAGMKTRLAQGQWTWKAPLGFVNSRDALGNKTLIADPVKAPLVQAAFELFSTGLYTKSEVLKKITALGLTTKGGRNLSLEEFSQLLRKPLYAGILSNENWRIEAKANFQPLISEELFRAVQENLAGTKRKFSRRTVSNPDFPLRHFVRCGNCSKPLTASWSKGRKTKYPYYRCQNRTCPSPINERKEVLESAFISFLRKLQPKPELMILFRKTVLGTWETRQKQVSAHCAVFERQIRDCKDQKRKLFEAWSGGIVSLDEYKEMKAEIDERLAVAQAGVDDNKLQESNLDALLNFAETILLDPVSFWLHCPIDQKQRLQRVLFPEGLTFEDGSYRTTTTCLLFSLLQSDDVKEEGLVALTGIEPVF